MHIVLVGSLLSHRLSQTVVELNNDYIPSYFVSWINLDVILSKIGNYENSPRPIQYISNKYGSPKLRNMALVFGSFQSFDGLRVTGKRDLFRYACCTVDET